MMRLPRQIAALALAGVMATTAACTRVVNPATGESELSAVTPQQEKALGAQEHPKVLAEFGGAYDDPNLKAYVTNIGQRLAANSELPDEQFTFTLLDTPVVNAFALPGGYVYVTRGLLGILNTEAELAGVMGHEIGHVTARHGARRQTTGMVAGILTAGLGILTGSRQAQQLGQIAAQGYLASYSRDHEREADGLGVRYLSRTGYDTLAMSHSLDAIGRHSELLSRASGQEAQGFNFLATHPQTPERVANTIALARQNPGAGANAIEGRNSYLDAINGMIYGSSPAQGFVRGNRFIHPELRFAFAFPDGFRVDNLPDAVVGSGPDGTRATFDLERDRDVAGRYRSMSDYIARHWARGARGRDLRDTRIGGFPAATAVVFMTAGDGSRFEAQIAAIRFGPTQIFRFMLAAPVQVAERYDRAFENSIYSFREIDAQEAKAAKPLRVHVMTVRRGDTVESLARLAGIDSYDVDRFRMINDLAPGEDLVPGRRVKVIRE